jgi:hypothetical protein
VRVLSEIEVWSSCVVKDQWRTKLSQQNRCLREEEEQQEQEEEEEEEEEEMIRNLLCDALGCCC